MFGSLGEAREVLLELLVEFGSRDTSEPIPYEEGQIIEYLNAVLEPAGDAGDEEEGE